MSGIAVRLLPTLKLLGDASSLVGTHSCPTLKLLGKSLVAGGTPLLPGIAPLQIFETGVSY
jgi:hypothetical protein